MGEGAGRLSRGAFGRVTARAVAAKNETGLDHYQVRC
jgi:hypothetical protein